MLKKKPLLIFTSILLVSLISCQPDLGAISSNSSSNSSPTISQSSQSSDTGVSSSKESSKDTPVSSSEKETVSSTSSKEEVSSSSETSSSVSSSSQNSSSTSSESSSSSEPSSSSSLDSSSSEEEESSSTSSDVPVVTEGEIEIVRATGNQESITVIFNQFENYTKYNAYYKIDGGSEYIKVDGMLIRKYPSNYRVDILGLKPANYSVKLVAVDSNNNEVEQVNGLANHIKVTAQVREGYAFINNHCPGAYTLEGTLKDNAVVIYVTDENKESVSLQVQQDKSLKTFIGIQNIITAFKKGSDKRPLCVRIIGNVTTGSSFNKGDLALDLSNKYTAGITIEGVGNDATCNGFGIRVKGGIDVEVRNLGFMNCNSDEGDSISFQQDNDYVWAHNNDLFYGDAGSDADQAKGDGNVDSKGTDHITHSYNHFWDAGKSCLLGMKKEGEDKMVATYHHNWFDHSDSRHPRVRAYTTHVYNNYFDGVAKYGIGSTMGSSIFSETNYFRNTKYPMLTSMQGSDISGDGEGTFSQEDGGVIKAYNNAIVEGGTFVPYSSTNNVEFDAYVVENRNDEVPSNVKAKQGGATYNGFDTKADFYDYNPQQTPEAAKNEVISYAGRLEGGDFKWIFDNSVDDTSYAVDPELKAALKAYDSSLEGYGLSSENNAVINGEGGSGEVNPDPDPGTDPDEPDTGEDDNPSTPIEADVSITFTEDVIKAKGDENFSLLQGSVKSDSGTTIDGHTYGNGLKLNSGETISFTTSEPMNLLMHIGGAAKTVVVDGTEYDVDQTTHVFTLNNLPAGNHTIKKGTKGEGVIYFIGLTKVE